MPRALRITLISLFAFALPLLTPSPVAAAACTPVLTIIPTTSTVVNGANASFTIALSNTGTGTCSGVYFSLYYPSELTFVSATPASTSGGYYWNFPSLIAGQTRTIALVTKAQTSQSLPRDVSLDGCLNAGGIDVCSAATVTIASTAPSPTPTSSATPVPSPTPPASPPPSPSATPAISGPERGIWFWDRTLPIGQTKINDIIATAELYDFNAIYYTIEDYGTYKAQNNQTKITQMRDALRTLCSQLHAKGIRCDAVTGTPQFGEQAGYTDALGVADFVLDYNRTVTAAQRVDILQYDVEPHVLARYEANKASVLTKYVGMVDAVVTRVKDGDANLRVDVVAPHFFDSALSWTPAIAFKGKTQHTFNHVMDSLERLPGGRYHVMAYRRATGGTNGTIPISRKEVETASASYPNTKVIVSQETGNFEPVTVISFYGLCRSALESALVTVQNAFASQSGFGGFSIHSFATYKSLKNC